jgi:hypothetical protein
MVFDFPGAFSTGKRRWTSCPAKWRALCFSALAAGLRPASLPSLPMTAGPLQNHQGVG